jgi:hypothetical protein
MLLLITFWSKFLGDVESSIVFCMSLNSLWSCTSISTSSAARCRGTEEMSKKTQAKLAANVIIDFSPFRQCCGAENIFFCYGSTEPQIRIFAPAPAPAPGCLKDTSKITFFELRNWIKFVTIHQKLLQQPRFFL